MSMIKNEMRKALRAIEIREAMIEEYIVEAEHQDGAEYWDLFEDVFEAVADFGLYFGYDWDEITVREIIERSK